MRLGAFATNTAVADDDDDDDAGESTDDNAAAAAASAGSTAALPDSATTATANAAVDDLFHDRRFQRDLKVAQTLVQELLIRRRHRQGNGNHGGEVGRDERCSQRN